MFLQELFCCTYQKTQRGQTQNVLADGLENPGVVAVQGRAGLTDPMVLSEVRVFISSFLFRSIACALLLLGLIPGNARLSLVVTRWRLWL